MKIKSKKPAVADVDMTPMIDIVFQLIAFFMVITNFEQIQADELVNCKVFVGACSNYFFARNW